MRLPHSRPGARQGFSLIELMVVIAIIVTLMGLLLAAVMAMISKGPEAQDRADVSGLTAALQNFKAKFGFYPPSRVYLAPARSMYDPANNPLHRDSLAAIGGMFPNLPANWSGFNWDGSAKMTKGVVLEGDQCLVFFLGGIPTVVSNTNACLGFSTVTSNPTSLGGERLKFYEFQPNRLVLIHGNAFPSYLNAWKDFAKPYAYFSPGKRGPNQYSSVATTVYGYGTSDCNITKTSLGVNPYASVWSATPQFINPESFQLISAGGDGVFGPGTTDTASVWNRTRPAMPTKAGEDDISNFSDRILGARQ